MAPFCFPWLCFASPGSVLLPVAPFCFPRLSYVSRGLVLLLVASFCFRLPRVASCSSVLLPVDPFCFPWLRVASRGIVLLPVAPSCFPSSVPWLIFRLTQIPSRPSFPFFPHRTSVPILGKRTYFGNANLDVSCTRASRPVCQIYLVSTSVRPVQEANQSS